MINTKFYRIIMFFVSVVSTLTQGFEQSFTVLRYCKRHDQFLEIKLVCTLFKELQRCFYITIYVVVVIILQVLGVTEFICIYQLYTVKMDNTTFMILPILLILYICSKLSPPLYILVYKSMLLQEYIRKRSVCILLDFVLALIKGTEPIRKKLYNTKIRQNQVENVQFISGSGGCTGGWRRWTPRRRPTCPAYPSSNPYASLRDVFKP